MSELILAPTSAITEGSGTSTGWINGASLTCWTDGDDATWVKSDWNRTSKGVYPNWGLAGVIADPAQVYAIGVRFRLRTISADPTPHFIVQLFGQAARLLTNPSHGGIPPLDTPAPNDWSNYDYVFNITEYDELGWAPAGVQSALEQTYLYVRTWPSTDDGVSRAAGTIQTAEQRVVLYYDATLPATAEGGYDWTGSAEGVVLTGEGDIARSHTHLSKGGYLT